MLVYRSANYAIVSITYILNTLRLGHGPYEKHYDDHNGKVFFQYQVNYKQYVVFGRGKRRIEKKTFAFVIIHINSSGSNALFLFCCILLWFGTRQFQSYSPELLPNIPAWISNHIPSKVLDKVIYPFPNFNGPTVEVWEWISNIIPHFIMEVIAYPFGN